VIRHLPEEMTPELIEEARWFEAFYDSFEMLEPYDYADPEGLTEYPYNCPDLTTWRTYGVIRGALASMCPEAYVQWASTVMRRNNLSEWVVRLPDQYGHLATGPTMIEAVVNAIRYLKERDDEPTTP